MNNHQESYSKVGQVVELFSKIYNEKDKENRAGGRGREREGVGKGMQVEKRCHGKIAMKIKAA